MSYLYLPLTLLSQEGDTIVSEAVVDAIFARATSLTKLYGGRLLYERVSCNDWFMALPCTDSRMLLDSKCLGSSRFRVPSLETLTEAFKRQPLAVREHLRDYRWAADCIGNFVLSVGFDLIGNPISKTRAPIIGNCEVMLWPELRNTQVGGALE